MPRAIRETLERRFPGGIRLEGDVKTNQTRRKRERPEMPGGQSRDHGQAGEQHAQRQDAFDPLARDQGVARIAE
ncbi:hypothetical protein SAMN05421720_13213, partial [Rhodospira trueperi]